jgi:hypothetical protein
MYGGNCGNLVAGRTVTYNGAQMSCDWSNWTVPAKINGGYCVYVNAGTAGGTVTLW